MFDPVKYLGWLQSAVAKHYSGPTPGPFEVIGPDCKVRTGSYQGKHVAKPRTPWEMEQVAELARKQLIETLEDSSGCLEFVPLSVDGVWNEVADYNNDDVADTGEVIGHAFDIANDARVWEAIVNAAIIFRRAAEARDQREALKIKEPKTVAEARALRDAREAA